MEKSREDSIGNIWSAATDLGHERDSLVSMTRTWRFARTRAGQSVTSRTEKREKTNLRSRTTTGSWLQQHYVSEILPSDWTLLLNHFAIRQGQLNINTSHKVPDCSIYLRLVQSNSIRKKEASFHSTELEEHSFNEKTCSISGYLPNTVGSSWEVLQQNSYNFPSHWIILNTNEVTRF